MFFEARQLTAAMEIWRTPIFLTFLLIFQYTISHVIYGDGICHVVKVRSFVRGWEVFQALFHSEVWFCLLGAVICINTLLSWICRQRDWSEWLGITFKALFTVPLVPIIKETKERLIIG